MSSGCAEWTTIDASGNRFDRRPFRAVPQQVQHPHRDAPVDDGTPSSDETCGSGRSFHELVKIGHLAGIRGRVGPDELMDVLADPGALPQGGPVVDENSHRPVMIASAV